MITLGEIVRRYAAQYRAQYAAHLLPSQQAVVTAIAQCRTAALGGHVSTCPDCGSERYSYHSCRNRHCPRCKHDDAQRWLIKQHELLLPVPYFLITFTLPAELREVAYRHQRQLYALLPETPASVPISAAKARPTQLPQAPPFLASRLLPHYVHLDDIGLLSLSLRAAVLP